jgi:hypothetical protein
MARKMHPNSLANLKKGKPIQEQKNAFHGRYKETFTLAAEMDFAAEDVMRLWKRLQRTPSSELRLMMMDDNAEPIAQTIASGILKDREDGTMRNFNQFMDRLAGKPRQVAEIDGNFNLTPPPIIIEAGEEDE